MKNKLLELILKIKHSVYLDDSKKHIISMFGEMICIIVSMIIICNSKGQTIVLSNSYCDSNTNESSIQKQCNELYEENKELAILVNYDNCIPNDYQLDLRKLDSGNQSVAIILYDDLVNMLKDAKKSGYTYWLASGYRDQKEQKYLVDQQIRRYYLDQKMDYEEAQNKTYECLAKPGYSEHQTGLAIDFLSSDNLSMDSSQELTEGNKWLRKNSYKYGFILRYPNEKQSITHIKYESWHFRYVGKDIAKFLYDNNLTLEEFYEYK